MTWPKYMLNLRQWVKWECKDIPVDLALAIIAHESAGQIGVKGRVKTRDTADLPLASGGTQPVNYALGLMQIVPSHVLSWNKRHKTTVFLDDMLGKDERSARLQTRIGCAYYANLVNVLHRFDSNAFPGVSPGNASAEQLKLALVAYAVGPGGPAGKRGLIPKLEILKARGLPLTLAQLAKSFPEWGYSTKKQKWINRPVFSARNKWNTYVKNQTVDQTEKVVSDLPKDTKKKEKMDFGILLPIAVALITQWMKKGGGQLFGTESE